MVRKKLSRRSLLAATSAATATALAGCTGEGSCRTIVSGAERVTGGSMRIYDVEAEAGQRLYIRFRRRSGPRAVLTVFDPDEERILGLEDVEELERTIDLTKTGTYAVVMRNDETATDGQWELTAAVYRGWCQDVF